MRDLKNLRQFWEKHAAASLMLCTIIAKSGSGYRAVGAKKIVCQDVGAYGHLSGGCLDGFIEQQAREKWQQAPFIESFSTRSEQDRLLGYQAGCAGVIAVLFERLPAIAQMDDYLPFGTPQKHAGSLVSLSPETLGQRCTLAEAPGRIASDTFFDRWQTPVQLVVIGGGPNNRAFADIAEPLGWDIRFFDYRDDHLPPDMPACSRLLPIGDIASHIPESPRTAVVVATHNYEADLNIVAQLSGKAFGYVGCIGPRHRFEQMNQDMPRVHSTAIPEDWAAKVKAPAGLFHGRNPEDISFSIIAEIQMTLGAAA